MTARADILLPARLGWSELRLVAGFASLALALALLPALAALSGDLIRDLRS